MDNALDLLDELNEEELAELEAEFDIEVRCHRLYSF